MWCRKYGNDSVVQIVTFGTLAAKGVVRDVGRVMDMPYASVIPLPNDPQRSEYDPGQGA